MAVSNLHTLDGDVLYSILTLCPNLTTLYSLITTHPTIYNVFSTRRRLILRLVFRRHGSMTAAEAFITRIQCANPIDYVAFREAWRPNSLPIWRSKRTVAWTVALLTAYHRAGLQDEGLAFAKQIAGMITELRREIIAKYMTLVRAVVKTYVNAKLSNEAVALQELVRLRLDPWDPEHSVLCKELVASYKKSGNEERALQLQIECWELYKTAIRPKSDVALDWARRVVKEYQLCGKDEEALEFHKRVRIELDPTTAPYIAWSRQLIHMLRRKKKTAEALTVTEEVWRHLDIDVTGYRAWTRQLSQLYEAMERPADAIAVCEACWTATTERLEQNPNNEILRYQTIGTGLLLAKVLKKYGRLEDAGDVEGRCKEFKDSHNERIKQIT
jgi:DNA-binding SARP family transcriptional activator